MQWQTVARQSRVWKGPGTAREGESPANVNPHPV